MPDMLTLRIRWQCRGLPMRIDFKTCVAVVALLLATTYAADWAIWRLRLGQGSGTEAVSVSQVTVATLKGNREEYYSDGETTVLCAVAAVPHGGHLPCWWVSRHRHVEIRP